MDGTAQIRTLAYPRAGANPLRYTGQLWRLTCTLAQRMLRNFRISLRQLAKSPAFALTAILTLALGIGANTAIFSLLDQALLRTLPVEHPEQLVTLQDTTTHENWR